MTDHILTVSSQPHPSAATVVTVAGELDHHTAPQLLRVLDGTPFSPDTPVVVDLSELVFCDSTGITALIKAYQHAHTAGAPLFFTGVNTDLMRVLEITGLSRIFSFQPTTEQAIELLTT